jgi:hypothetical protein
VVVAAVGWVIWRNHVQSTAATAWNEVEITPAIIQYPAAQMNPVYQFLGYAEVMDKASRDYSGTPAGDWARLLAADTCLAVGQNELITQRDNAAQHFNIAMDHYQKTVEAMSNPIARQRAMFGKGRLLESFGKIDDAKAAYQDLNEKYPKGIYAAIAEGRLTQLGKPETKEFYDALAKYNPKAKTEKPTPKKGSGNTTTGPRGKLDNMTLPDNPEPVSPGETVKPGSSSGTASGASTGTAKTSAAPAAPATSAAPAVPATSAAPPSAAPKTTAATPPPTGAPAASNSGPAKK